MRIVFIDPGVWAIGWVVADDSFIVDAGCTKVKKQNQSMEETAEAHREQIGRVFDLAVIETMELRPTDTLSRCKSLLQLQSISLIVATRIAYRVKTVPVSQWKAPIPKPIHHARFIQAFTNEECSVIDRALISTPKANHKEILDAAGLAMYYHGRTDRGGCVRR